MAHWKVSSRVIPGVVATLVVLIMVACGPSAPDAESVVVDGTSLAPATESPGLTPGAPVEVTRTSAPAKGQEEEPVAPVPTTPAEDPTPGRLEGGEVVALAQADLARRLGVANENIVVKSVEAVQWPDASLGCPQPGMMYAQVITPGFRVVFGVGDAAYEYHTDAGQSLILCEEGGMGEVPSVSGTVEPGMGPLIDMAREDLVARLSIDVADIEVLEAKAVAWPDASLGCPLPGMKYRQVPMDGALVRLAVDGKVYEYHSGGGRNPFLCEQPLKLEKDAPPQIDLLKLTPPSPDE